MERARVDGRGGKTLMSKWGVLNRNLLGVLYPVKPDGQGLLGNRVAAPITDTSIELGGNWQSAFEQSGLSNLAPSLMGLLQSGEIGALAQAIGPDVAPGGEDGPFSSMLREAVEGAQRFSEEARSRTAVTKLNSTRVYLGGSSAEIPMTMHFRAFDDPVAEVMEPIDQLAKWTLPKKLAAAGSIASAIRNFRDGEGFLKSLLPSEAPQLVGLQIAGYSFAPLVIESMNMPLTVPRDSQGRPLNVAVQIKLASLAALDAEDWQRAIFRA